MAATHFLPEQDAPPKYSDIERHALALRTPVQTTDSWIGRSAFAAAPARTARDFVKQSKTPDATLRIENHQGDAELPTYGFGEVARGTVELAKPESVAQVEVKLEGTMRLEEIGEGDTATYQLASSKTVLFDKGSQIQSCPRTLPFELGFPESWEGVKGRAPLPPSYAARMKGVPGFSADIAYTITVTVTKAKSSVFGPAKIIVSMPVIYSPRSRPAGPLPGPFHIPANSHGIVKSPDWACFDTTIRARSTNRQDIESHLYLPSSRIFSLQAPIPFHLTFTSSSHSLAAFLPFGPTPSLLYPAKPPLTKVQLIRQTTCDVRNEEIKGTKTDIWASDTIGFGVLRHTGDGPDFLCFQGSIAVSRDVRVGSFKAGGLYVKDFILLTMTPPEPSKCPFKDIRRVIPVRLTTDSWSPLSMAGMGGRPGSMSRFDEASVNSVPSNPEDYVEALPQLQG